MHRKARNLNLEQKNKKDKDAKIPNIRYSKKYNKDSKCTCGCICGCICNISTSKDSSNCFMGFKNSNKKNLKETVERIINNHKLNNSTSSFTDSQNSYYKKKTEISPYKKKKSKLFGSSLISLKKEKVNRSKNNYETIKNHNIADISDLINRSENKYNRKEKGIPTPNIKQKKEEKKCTCGLCELLEKEKKENVYEIKTLRVKSESRTYKGRDEIKPLIEKNKNYSSIKDKKYLYEKGEQQCNCGLSHTIFDLNKYNNNKSLISSKYLKTEKGKDNEIEKKRNYGGINEIKYQIALKEQKDDKQKTRVYSENRYNRLNDIKDREKSEPRFNNYQFQPKKYEREKICMCGKDHEICLCGLDDHKSKIEVSTGRRGIYRKQEEKRKIDDENNVRRRNIEVQKKTNICLCGKDHGICLCGLDDHKSRIEVSTGRRGISEKQKEKIKIDDENNLRKRNIEVQKKVNICLCGKDHGICLCGLDEHKSRNEISRGRRGISEKQEEKRKIDEESNLRKRNIEVQKKANICLCGKDHGVCLCGLDERKSRFDYSRGRRVLSEKQEEKRKIDIEKDIRKRNIEVQKKRKICMCGKEHGICTCGIDEICLCGKAHGICLCGLDDALKRKKDEEKTKKILEEYRRKREEESKRKKEEEKRIKLEEERRKREEELRKKKEEEKRRQLEEERKAKLEEERKRKEYEEKKKKLLEEIKLSLNFPNYSLKLSFFMISFCIKI